jgi:hypothetical protein
MQTQVFKRTKELHVFLPVCIHVYMLFQNVDCQFINNLFTANDTEMLGYETINTKEETTRNKIISRTQDV